MTDDCAVLWGERLLEGEPENQKAEDCSEKVLLLRGDGEALAACSTGSGRGRRRTRAVTSAIAAAHFPDAELSRMKGLGHAEMAAALTQFAERHGT